MSITRIGQARSFSRYLTKCRVGAAIGFDLGCRLEQVGGAGRADKATGKETSEDKCCESSQSSTEDTFLAWISLILSDHTQFLNKLECRTENIAVTLVRPKMKRQLCRNAILTSRFATAPIPAAAAE